MEAVSVSRWTEVGAVSRVREAVRRFFHGPGRQARGKPLVVAVSGGQDSLCLLDALHAVGPDFGLLLEVAHVNHKLRGVEAEEDARFVEQTAEGLGLPHLVVARDVPRYAWAHRLGREVAARYVRYQALARRAAEIGASGVATGHTGDDVAETLLLNLLRGTGLRGLRGPQPLQRLHAAAMGPPYDEGDARTGGELPPLDVFRPLLDVHRRDTAAYCRERGLAPRVDSSNLDRRHLRNRVRLELIPLLERYNPRIREALNRCAATVSVDYDLLQAAIEDGWASMLWQEDGSVRVLWQDWLSVPKGVQSLLFRRAYQHLKGGLQALEWKHTRDGLLFLKRPGTGGAISLAGGIVVEKEHEGFRMTYAVPAAAVESVLAEGLPLSVPGELTVPGAGVLKASLLHGRDAVRGVLAGVGKTSALEAWVDFEEAGPPLVVRNRRPGDWLVPLGMAGKKKLHDLLIDARVPRAARDSVPLVVGKAGIVWVVGHRVAERVKVREGTTAVLHLVLDPDGGNGDGG